MPLLSIGEVARQVGIAPSALRYYERVGVAAAAATIVEAAFLRR